jgi:preprotein translocase subunit SecD
MIYIPRYQIILAATLSVLAMMYAFPNLVSKETRAGWAQHASAFMPVHAVSLGLDLQGGSHLLLQVDLETVLRDKMEDMLQSIRQQMKEDKMILSSGSAGKDQVQVTVPSDQVQAAKSSIRKVDQGIIITDGDQTGAFSISYDDRTLRDIKTQILGQSIEIVRRRVDESGTKESTIVRQGDDRILVQIPGLDDPARIKDLLGKTAKLSFHLVDTGMSSAAGSKRLPSRDNPGEEIAIKRRAILTGDMLTGARSEFGQDGAPVVSFKLNSIGAKKFCNVTRENTGQPFAIVLDNEVISAPRINEPICGGSAMISGRFSLQETSDLALLLRAGALPAPLKVVEERSVGPSLGSDSVAAGKIAGIVALLLVMVNMIAGYGLFGLFAAMALVMNVIMIFAVLSILGATLTLPGIAGIVLTIGMAVDANVLIFERIREELRAGKSPVAALDSGYARAFDTIVDSNLTTLIAALVLFLLGSGPIKGFAITLSIGIITSIYSAVVLTRIIVVAWYKKTRPSTLNI